MLLVFLFYCGFYFYFFHGLLAFIFSLGRKCIWWSFWAPTSRDCSLLSPYESLSIVGCRLYGSQTLSPYNGGFFPNWNWIMEILIGCILSFGILQQKFENTVFSLFLSIFVCFLFTFCVFRILTLRFQNLT